MSEQDLPDKQPSSGGPQESDNQLEQPQILSDKKKKIIPTRTKLYMQTLHTLARKCNAISSKGTKCGCPALQGGDYCQHHATLPPLQKLKESFDLPPAQYTQIDSDNRDFRKDYEHFLAQKNLTGLRDEIALCKAYISQMLKYPSYSGGCIPLEQLQVQMDVFKTLRGLCLAHKKMELQDKFFNRANDSIKQVVTQVVLIIDRFVTDSALKAVIANEIFKLGKKEDQPQGVVDMSAIDTEAFLKSESSTEKEKMVDNAKITSSGPSELKKEERSSSAMIETFARQTDAAEMIPV